MKKRQLTQLSGWLFKSRSQQRDLDDENPATKRHLLQPPQTAGINAGFFVLGEKYERN